ncbi:hypothetical protein SAMN05660199_03954 [Klenkia soli]|uniref:Uncharacterized protein n=1 Tax=Klenkia soli TaxID=1052260 RepID=A0A1H0SWY6_9ACTN|nr:hypothetical protein [Klenkia soli]SDP46307.1 hypothetical protein SAMN05660199_03954 [Klenkia soli]
MTTTPDPLDVLKYAYVVTWAEINGHEDFEQLQDTLEALVAPLVTSGVMNLDDLRYSDGRLVTVTTEIDVPSRGPMDVIQLPPGYPTGQTAA